ncbi:MAG: hypothetical protein QOE77_1925 [Blastocatellia bacterium]|jgi:hypothetical protein|nr:hypothetical protein [Blastocatellia bacterium]
MKQILSRGSNQNSTSGSRRSCTLHYLFFAAVFILVTSSGFSATAQVASTNRNSPRRITSATITDSVSRPLGDYAEVFYSVDARAGFMTIDFTAVARDGMNIVLGVEGRGVFEAIGPLVSGGNDEMKGNVKFRVARRQRLLINVRYSGTAKYTIDLSGSAIIPGR